MKKKILAMVLMLTMVFGLASCGQRSEGTLMIDVPDGFVYDTYVHCYLGPYYPEELANINYYSYENDGTFSSLTKENVEEAMEESLSASFWQDIDITLTKWEKTKVDGYKALVYGYEFECDGVDYEQIQVAINGKDYIHYVTFSDYGNSPYKREFEQCIRKMRFE